MRHPDAATDIHVYKKDLDEIEQTFVENGLTYKVLIDNLENVVAKEENEVKLTTYANGFNYGTYNRLDAVSIQISVFDNIPFSLQKHRGF